MGTPLVHAQIRLFVLSKFGIMDSATSNVSPLTTFTAHEPSSGLERWSRALTFYQRMADGNASTRMCFKLLARTLLGITNWMFALHTGLGCGTAFLEKAMVGMRWSLAWDLVAD